MRKLVKYFRTGLIFKANRRNLWIFRPNGELKGTIIRIASNMNNY